MNAIQRAQESRMTDQFAGSNGAPTPVASASRPTSELGRTVNYDATKDPRVRDPRAASWSHPFPTNEKPSQSSVLMIETTIGVCMHAVRPRSLLCDECYHSFISGITERINNSPFSQTLLIQYCRLLLLTSAGPIFHRAALVGGGAQTHEGLPSFNLYLKVPYVLTYLTFFNNESTLKYFLFFLSLGLGVSRSWLWTCVKTSSDLD